jgi:hypothetical protein
MRNQPQFGPWVLCVIRRLSLDEMAKKGRNRFYSAREKHSDNGRNRKDGQIPQRMDRNRNQ